MRRRARAILAAASLLMAGLAVPVAQADQGRGGGADDGLSVWHAEVSAAQVPLLAEAGTDGHELSEQVPDRGSATVELYLTDRQAGELRGKGVEITEEPVDQPYGIDFGLRDPFGNHLRIAQMKMP